MTIEKLVILSKGSCGKSRLELIERLKPLVLSSINKYYSIGDYEDLIQEGNILILESIKDFDLDYGVHFLAYIKSKLKYYYLNKNKIERELSLNAKDANGIEFIERLESNINIEKIIIERIENRYLEKQLESLSNRQKEIIREFYFEDLSLNEIAEKLSISYQTVANLKTQGINKLKTIVKNI